MKTQTKTHSLKNKGALIFSVAAILSTAQAQAGQGPQPSICNRACWVARAPSCNPGNITALTRATIHHTAGVGEYNTSGLEASKASLRGIQNLHMGNGWCDISYAFLVDKWGNIFEGRSGAMTGLPKGYHDACNANSFGFTALGYFHPPYNHAFTGAMENAMYDVIAWRMPSSWSPYGAGTYCSQSVGYLDGHRKVVATACPGDIIHNNYITANMNGGPMRDGVNARKNPTSSPGTRRVRWFKSDWDGDGKADSAIWRPSTGLWSVSKSTGGTAQLTGFGFSTDVPVPADYDGDGKTDYAVWRPSNGYWYIQSSTAGYLTLASFGFSTDIPVPGDYDGDGKADSAIWRPSTGLWSVSKSTGGTMQLTGFGFSTDVPVPADYDGDGKMDFAVWRPSNGNWYIQASTVGYLTLASFGFSTDIPVPGDYDGDGKADSAIWRPSTGLWSVSKSTGGIMQLTGFGFSTDVPVPHDFDGDGKMDYAVWRPSNGNWYIQASSVGYLTLLSFGFSTDIPF